MKSAPRAGSRMWARRQLRARLSSLDLRSSEHEGKKARCIVSVRATRQGRDSFLARGIQVDRTLTRRIPTASLGRKAAHWRYWHICCSVLHDSILSRGRSILGGSGVNVGEDVSRCSLVGCRIGGGRVRCISPVFLVNPAVNESVASDLGCYTRRADDLELGVGLVGDCELDLGELTKGRVSARVSQRNSV